MRKMTRQKALDAIRAAGTTSNHRDFMRLYVENRISYPVALAEYRKGVEIAKRITARDLALSEIAHERGLHADDDADVIEEIYAERAVINNAPAS